MADLSIRHSMEQSHGVIPSQTRGADMGGGVPNTYVVPFPRIMKSVEGPIPGCLAKAHSSGGMRAHFMYRHFLVEVLVMQYGSDPLPQYYMCGIQMPVGCLIKYHKTARYFINKKMRLRWNYVKVVSQSAKMEFKITEN